MADIYPKAVLILSGKRKSGKDYVANLLQQCFGENRCAVMRLSGPLKKQYAEKHNLDFRKLLDSSEYKEKHREAMIKWGEAKRVKDPGYFCRLATLGNDFLAYPVWIICDARRKSDVKYFKEIFPAPTLSHTVRIVASEEVRKQRNWKFVKGIDDAKSECGLDSGVSWDFIISNDGDNTSLNTCLSRIVETLDRKVKFFISSDSDL